MKRVLTAVVLIPLVLLVLFRAPLWLFTLVVGLVAMGAAWEYLKLVDAYGQKSMKTTALLIIASIFVAFAPIEHVLDSDVLAFSLLLGPCLLFLAPLLFLTAAMSTEHLNEALPRAASSALAIPYLGFPFLCLVLMRKPGGGLFLIVFTFVIVWSGDIFAYYAGRAFGKHKLAPRISPGKTWEGTIASFVGSVFLAHILFVDNAQIMEALFRWGLAPSANGLRIMTVTERLTHGLILGGSVNVAAQVGDLVESMIKRGAEVKDSGTLLPGHGGILDRIDALLFALPVAAIYLVYSNLFS